MCVRQVVLSNLQAQSELKGWQPAAPACPVVAYPCFAWSKRVAAVGPDWTCITIRSSHCCASLAGMAEVKVAVA